MLVSVQAIKFQFISSSSSIIQDLKEEYLDIPTEISAGTRAQQILSRSQKEKEEYEETYLTRLPVTKSEKHRYNKLTTLGEHIKLIKKHFSHITVDAQSN